MVKYARCNAILSLALNQAGEECRYLAKADTEQGVVDDMVSHIDTVHQMEASELVNNIKGVMHTTRS